MPMVPAGSPLFIALRESHYTIGPELTIYHPEAGFVDISQRLVGFTINYSMDNACGQATFQLARGRGIDSLSPLVNPSSYNPATRPLLDPSITIIMNIRITWAGGEFLLAPFFNGRIDRVDIAKGGLLELQCRDIGGYYLNDFIKPPAVIYGSDVGVDLEDVIKAKLEDNGWPPDGLAVSDPTGYALFSHVQEPMSLMEAIRADAQKIGWDLRHFPGDTEPLRLYDPGRGRAVDLVIDDFLGPTMYKEITELSYGDDDVRNLWYGYWEDENGEVHGPIIVQDADSMNRYGERFAQVYVNRAEGIRSDEAMTVMLNGALADSKDPFASHRILMPFYPLVLLNDVQFYNRNNDEYNDEQVFTVAAYTHQWQAAAPGRKGITRTTIGCRGKPIAAYREYRRSVIPRVLASTTDIDPDLWAPEGTIHFKVDSLAPPMAMARARRTKRLASTRPDIILPKNPDLVIAGRAVGK